MHSSDRYASFTLRPNLLKSNRIAMQMLPADHGDSSKRAYVTWASRRGRCGGLVDLQAAQNSKPAESWLRSGGRQANDHPPDKTSERH